MAEIQVILNPYAGHGQGARLKPTVIEVLRSHDLDFGLIETSEPGAAMRLAREAIEAGYQTLIAVGGDGTVHEIVNGLMLAGAGPDDIRLGIVPVGSGNDFVKMLDLPAQDLATACLRVARDHTRIIDVGRINQLLNGQRVINSIDEGRPRYFVNALGMGFDALVACESRKITWLTGLPLYLIAVIRTLALTYRTPHMDIKLDDQRISQTTTLVTIGNGRCQGGGFWITPEAEIDDEWLDLAIARGLSRLGILRLIPDVMQGTHVDKEPVTMARARRITIDSAHPLPVHADGEILATRATHLEVEVVPRSLRVFT